MAVVVAVNRPAGRAPVFDRSDRRSLKRYLGCISIADVNRVCASGAYRPIVNAVQIYASGEQIGVARQSHRRQKTAVTAPPQSNPRLVNVAAAAQVMCSGD